MTLLGDDECDGIDDKCGGGDDYLFHSWNGKAMTKSKLMPLTCRSAPGSGKGSRIWVKDMTCKKEHPQSGEFLKYDKVRCKNWPEDEKPRWPHEDQ